MEGGAILSTALAPLARPLGWGEERSPARRMADALVARDAGCVWPGCDRPVTLTEAHHLTNWARGGSTDLANLVIP